MQITSSVRGRVVNGLLAVVASTLLAACGTIGDTGAVKHANELAIACKTDQALIAVDRAAQGVGLAAHIADLQRVVFLRDAGRVAEANAALAARNARIGADAEAAAKAERGISESLEELHAERQKRSGRRVCP
jgi:hypothetical protein